MLDAPLDIPLIPILATLSCGVTFAQTNKCFENGGGREPGTSLKEHGHLN